MEVNVRSLVISNSYRDYIYIRSGSRHFELLFAWLEIIRNYTAAYFALYFTYILSIHLLDFQLTLSDAIQCRTGRISKKLGRIESDCSNVNVKTLISHIYWLLVFSTFLLLPFRNSIYGLCFHCRAIFLYRAMSCDRPFPEQIFISLHSATRGIKN